MLGIEDPSISVAGWPRFNPLPAESRGEGGSYLTNGAVGGDIKLCGVSLNLPALLNQVLAMATCTCATKARERSVLKILIVES